MKEPKKKHTPKKPEKKNQEQEKINSLPPLEPEDMKVTPTGTLIIARGYISPEKTHGGIILTEKQRKIVPCLHVMKTGVRVDHVKPGQWVMIRDNFQPVPVKYGHEMFFMFQEHDVMLIYDEQPPYEDIMETETMIVRDLTEYVKIDKMSKIEAKVTERYEGDDPDEQTKDRHA